MAAMLCRRACSRNRTRGVLSSPALPGAFTASCPAVQRRPGALDREALLRRINGQRRIPGLDLPPRYAAPVDGA